MEQKDLLDFDPSFIFVDIGPIVENSFRKIVAVDRELLLSCENC